MHKVYPCTRLLPTVEYLLYAVNALCEASSNPYLGNTDLFQPPNTIVIWAYGYTNVIHVSSLKAPFVGGWHAGVIR